MSTPKPIAQLAYTAVNATLGSIVQLDGRGSSDPTGLPLTWSWSFVQVPIGSEVVAAGFKDLRPDSTAVSFIPDKTGLYLVRLIVNNGVLDSDPITSSINIQYSTVPVGVGIVPDAQFLWSYISDFWNLVEDREKITSIWSATIQLIGAELIKLWSNDRNKSLSTIQQAIQRRWQKVRTRTDLTAFADQRIIAGKTDAGTNGSSGIIGSTPGAGMTSVFYVPLGNPGDGDRTNFINLLGNYGPSGRVVVINGSTYVVERVNNNGLLLAPDLGGMGVDLVTTFGSNIVHTLSEIDFAALGVQVGDRLVIRTGPDTGTYKVSSIGGDHNAFLAIVHLADPPGGPVPSFSDQPAGVGYAIGRPYSTIILRYATLPDGLSGVTWRIPHLLHIPGANFGLNGVQAGDVLVLEFTRNDIKLSATIRVQVVGAVEDRLGFEFSTQDLDPVVNSGTEASSSSTSTGITTISGLSGMRPSSAGGFLEILNGSDPGVYLIRSYVSSSSVVIDGSPDEATGLHWVERSRGGLNVERSLFRQLAIDLKLVPTQATDVAIASMAEALISYIPVGVNLATRPFAQQLITVRAKEVIHNKAVPVPIETISMPALQEVLVNPPVVLRENFDYTIDQGMLTFVDGLFTVQNPTPEMFWAENALYDNSAAIENNFGTLVGLLKNDLTSSKTKAPYLNAVKGLIFAYTNGPSAKNLRLGLQILMGLPFTASSGVIKEVQPNFTTNSSGQFLDRILIEDLDKTGTLTGDRSIYYYPNLIGLETNPVTGTLYQPGDYISAFSPISKGVDVTDYVKDPLWWKNALYGLEILKYFTFRVMIDNKIFDSNDAQFAVKFIKAIKPVYTKIIVALLATLTEDITLEDAVSGSIRVNLYDNDTGLESVYKSSDDNKQGAVLWNLGSRPFQTRIPKMLRDVRTYLNHGDVAVHSDTGWNINYIRERTVLGDEATYYVTLEGDILYLHRGQLGAGLYSPGLYEIGAVTSPNDLTLKIATPLAETEELVTYPDLDSSIFPYGSNLTATILRRQTGTVLLGTVVTPGVGDLDISASGVASSPTAKFLTNNVMPGDFLVIESGVLLGEYIINLVAEGSVQLRRLDGTHIFVATDDNVFRVVRPSLQRGIVHGAKSLYVPDDQMYLSVPSTAWLSVRDIFTPGMVGTYISVVSPDVPENNGIFLVTGYSNPGLISIESSSTTSDAGPNSTLQLDVPLYGPLPPEEEGEPE